MAEAMFSEDGKYYSTITKDGRLKIWDTETNVLKQEYTPDLHLTSPPTCLQWTTVSQSVSNLKGNRSNSNASTSENESQCIVLGTTNGKLLIYSISQAKIINVWVPAKHFSAKVTALDWSRKYGLYSCTKDSRVYEWNIEDGSVKQTYNISIENNTKQGSNINAIKIIPHNQHKKSRYLVTASYQLSLWRLHNKDVTLIKSLGYSTSQTAILSLVSFNDAYYIVEGSENERLLSFWDVTVTDESTQNNNDEPTPNKRHKRKHSAVPVQPTPMYSFVLEDAPRAIDSVLREGDGVQLNIVAATRSGVVHYYQHTLNGSSTKPIKPSLTIQTTTADAKPLPLQCCRLQQDGNINLGYLNDRGLVFEKITPDLKTKTQVLIRGDVKEKKKTKQNDNSLLRTEFHSSEATYLDNTAVAPRKRTAPGANPSIEVPMEARLQNLALDVNSKSNVAVNENLTKLLIQGLHSKDKDIILTVLQKNDPRVARVTVSNLPPQYVFMLLEQLTEMSLKKTSQCAAACVWAGAALRGAGGALGGGGGGALAALLAALTNRRSHLCQLLNLKGRLELTLTQRLLALGAEKQDEQTAVLDYNDSSDEDNDADMEPSQSESGASWDESDEQLSDDGDVEISDAE
ncbi:WD repeat-containing protein 43 [Bombyx mandarina]|uniref:WD repeat-containing protein 43 n=1 Tax=Bombyx mandarina TaxID=7092 RepID=A0A6J2JDU4_BOMMA|nr:WD repeat-containing protein 43 [Bombyx mandarina]